MTTGTIEVQLKANTGTFETDLKRARRTTQDEVSGIGDEFKKVGEFLAAAFAVDRIFEFASEIANLGHELEEMGQKMGVSASDLSALKVVADQSGVSMEDLQGSVDKFSKNAVAAAGGAKLQSEQFKALGISVLDANGKIKPTSVLLDEVARKFASFRDSNVKTADAMALFGKSGANLIPFLNRLGSEGLDGATAAAKRFGVYMDGDAIKAAEEFRQNMVALHEIMTGLGMIIVNATLPALTSIVHALVDYSSDANAAQSRTESFKNVILDIAEGFITLSGWIQKATAEMLGFADRLGAIAQIASDTPFKRILGDELTLGANPLPWKKWGAADDLQKVIAEQKQHLADGQKALDAAFKNVDESLKAIDKDTDKRIDALWSKTNGGGAGSDIKNDGLDAAILPQAGATKAKIDKIAEAFKSLDDQIKQHIDLTNAEIASDAKLSPGMQQVQKFQDLLTDGKIKYTAAQRAAGEADLAVLRTNTLELDAKNKLAKATKDLADITIKFSDQDRENAAKLADETAQQLQQIQQGNGDLRLQNALKQEAINYDKQRIELEHKFREDESLDAADYIADLKKISEDHQAMTKAITDDYDQIKAAEADWHNGVTAALNEFLAEAQNTAKLTQQAFSSAFTGIVDSLTNLIVTGKSGWRQLLQSIASSFVHIVIEQELAKLMGPDGPLGGLMSMLGIGSAGAAGTAATTANTAAIGLENANLAANTAALAANTAALGASSTAGVTGSGGFDIGSLFGNSGGMFSIDSLFGGFAKGAAFAAGKLTPFAGGGIVSAPMLFPMASGMGLMGEAGPEAIVPLTRTSDGSLGIKSVGAGGAVNSSITVIVHSDGNTRRGQQSDDDTARQLGKLIEAKAVEVIIRQKRPGGLLAN